MPEFRPQGDSSLHGVFLPALVLSAVSTLMAGQAADVTDDCTHEQRVLLRLDCGSGGIQYRRYCMTCWRAVSQAIPHADVRAETRDGEPPLADLAVLHGARDAYLRALWGRR